MEFFYFGCKTCYQLVPALAQWSHETGIGVTLVPVHSDNAMVDAARLYHTFAEMNVLSRMYELGYVIFQTDKSELKGEARINDYLERHRVNKERFWKIWNSDKVNKRLAGSLALTQQAKIYKTPTFLVKGRYMVNIDAITHVEHLFQLLEYLNKKPD
jgi:thiol:disulfide interchange protein DsbA